MKTKLRLMMTMLLLAVMGSVFGESVTFTAGTDTSEGTSITKDGITIFFSNGVFNRTDNYRCYSGASMTISSENSKITQIDFTATSSNPMTKFSGNPDVGSWTDSNKTQWTGEASEINFGTTSGQARITKIVVTVKGSDNPTTYTVAYDCYGGESGCPDDLSGVTAGSKITLPEAPTKANYTFSGWNDGTSTYQAGKEYTVNSNVIFTAQWTESATSNEEWVLTSLADLTADDIFVIVGNNGDNYAMTNDKGTTYAPGAYEVIVNGNKLVINVPENLKWNVSIDASGYTFYPNGSSSTWLYCTNTNNGVRVGTGNAKHFTLSNEGYLTTTETTEQRYLGIYSSQDWRCYTSINANIEGQSFAFYKRVLKNAVARPVYNPVEGTYYGPQNVTITSETEGATIYYTTDGSTPTTSSTVYSSAIPVTETTTIKAIAVKEGLNNSEVASATYTIQALVDPTVQLMQERVSVGETMQISYPDNLDINFSSTDNSKATVSSTGLITGVSSGSVTISAVWNEGNGYNSGRQDFNITVVDATIYVKVTNNNQLVPGNEYILVATASDVTVAMGQPQNNNKIRGYANVTIVDDKVVSSDANLSVLTLGGSAGAWTFQDGTYLAYSGDSNELHIGTDPTQEACQWIVTSDFQLQPKTNTNRYLQYNSGTNAERFACYKGTQINAYLYVKEGSPAGNFEAVSFATDGYKSYVTENPIDWGKTLERNSDNVDVHAYQVTALSKTAVTLEELGDGVITSAETPVIVKGKKGMNLLVIASEDGSDISGTNLLKKGSERSESEKDFMYVLQKSKQWSEYKPYEQYNFYPLNPARWNEIGDRQAYLVLATSPDSGGAGSGPGVEPKPIGMRFIHATGEDSLVSEDAGLVDGINDIQQNASLDGEYYSISGVRVAAPTKGLYIVNGKKVLVK